MPDCRYGILLSSFTRVITILAAHPLPQGKFYHQSSYPVTSKPIAQFVISIHGLVGNNMATFTPAVEPYPFSRLEPYRELASSTLIPYIILTLTEPINQHTYSHREKHDFKGFSHASALTILHHSSLYIRVI